MNTRWKSYSELPEDMQKSPTYLSIANAAYRIGRQEEQAEQNTRYMLGHKGELGMTGGVTVAGVNMTSRAGRVLMNTAKEAEQLGHKYIGTEHLLLALLNPHESVAANVLRSMGVTVHELRRATLQFLGQSDVAADVNKSEAAIKSGDASIVSREDAVARYKPAIPNWQPYDLKFADLTEANLRRLPLFKNKHGKLTHAPGGPQWELSDWITAIVGELGEAANILKKVKRGDITLEDARPMLSDELADVMTYLDILCNRLNIELYEALLKKWNEVSDRVGCAIRLNKVSEDAVERRTSMTPAPSIHPDQVLCQCGHEKQFHRSGPTGCECDDLNCDCTSFHRPTTSAPSEPTDLPAADLLRRLSELRTSFEDVATAEGLEALMNSPEAKAWQTGEVPMTTERKIQEIVRTRLDGHEARLIAIEERLGAIEAYLGRANAVYGPGAEQSKRIDEMLLEIPWKACRGDKPADEVTKLKELLAASRQCVQDTANMNADIDRHGVMPYGSQDEAQVRKNANYYDNLVLEIDKALGNTVNVEPKPKE